MWVRVRSGLPGYCLPRQGRAGSSPPNQRKRPCAYPACTTKRARVARETCATRKAQGLATQCFAPILYSRRRCIRVTPLLKMVTDCALAACGNRRERHPEAICESLGAIRAPLPPQPPKPHNALSSPLRHPTGWNALIWNEGLTLKPNTPSFDPSARDTLRRSVAQKAASGFPPCQTQGVRNRARIARFFLFRPLKGWTYGFGRMGPRKRAVPCDGSGNPVRPAHQISTLVRRFIEDHKEAYHV